MSRDWERRADDGDGRYAIACGLLAVARSIDWLGNGDAAMTMGAIEAYGLHIGKKMDALTDAISGIGEIISDTASPP